MKRQRVNALLEAGEAAWCPPVRLELWRGVTNDNERKTLRRYEALLPDYEIGAEERCMAEPRLRCMGVLTQSCAQLADFLVCQRARDCHAEP